MNETKRSPLAVALLGLATTLAGLPAGAAVIGGPVTCGGNTYFLLSSQSWSSAETEAVGLGGHLATINDAAENECARLFAGSNAWIGFNDIASEGNFVWTSGETPGFTNWDGGEPNNLGGEDCTELRAAGGWNDLPCTGTRPALAEVAGSPNVPDGDQAGYTTSGSLEQVVAASPGDTCTFSMWVGKRSDGAGIWGRWFVQLTTGGWNIQNVMNGSLAAQSAEWAHYQTTFTVGSFPNQPIKLRLKGQWGFEVYDQVTLDCGSGDVVSNGSFESPVIPDGTWSTFGSPAPDDWTTVGGGAGLFNPNTTQMNDFF